VAPEPIFQEGPVDTPFVYTVSGTGEVIPRACAANYDGSGAGGDFVPALIFRSQAGHVISRAILQSTVTAGDDAEVSWFPGVKAAAASAGSGLVYCIAATDTPYTIPTTGGVQNNATTWLSVLPATAPFQWPVSGNSAQIGVTTAGLYALFYTHITAASWPAPASGFIVSSANMATYGQGFITEDFFLNNTTTALFAGTGGRAIVGVQMWNLPAADVMTLFTGNATAGNFTMNITKALLVRLGDNIPGTVI
jgi:hypothetical protein